MAIHTERLTLRPWRETDAASLFTYASDPDVGPAAGWPPHRSIEESREIIRTVFAAPHTFAVCLAATDEPVGSIGSCRLAVSQTVEMTVLNSKWAIGSPSRSGAEALPPKQYEPCSAMRSKRLAARRFGADTTRAITSRYAFSKSADSRRITLSATYSASLWAMYAPSALRV